MPPPSPPALVVICDVCGKNCQKPSYIGPEYAELRATWGYDSRKDLKQHAIDLCEDCFDHVLHFLKERADFYNRLDENSALYGREYGG